MNDSESETFRTLIDFFEKHLSYFQVCRGDHWKIKLSPTLFVRLRNNFSIFSSLVKVTFQQATNTFFLSRNMETFYIHVKSSVERRNLSLFHSRAPEPSSERVEFFFNTSHQNRFIKKAVKVQSWRCFILGFRNPFLMSLFLIYFIVCSFIFFYLVYAFTREYRK